MPSAAFISSLCASAMVAGGADSPIAFMQGGVEVQKRPSEVIQALTKLFQEEQALDGNVRPQAMAYGGGRFLAGTGRRGQTEGHSVWRSTDGKMWTEAPSFTPESITGLAYGNGVYVAASEALLASSGGIYTSTDGVTWTFRRSPSPFAQASLSQIPGFSQVIFAEGVFLSFQSGWANEGGATFGTRGAIHSSTDGITWTWRTHTDELVLNPPIIYGGGKVFNRRQWAIQKNYDLI